jgi:HlyD family secretion protein
MSAGSSAELTVDVAKAAAALVVPTSAVHSTSPGHSYVVALRSGRETQTPVTVGVVGDIDTQITSGVTPGETVVLADPTQALPSSSTNSTGPTFGGPGGFPGGGARTNGGAAPAAG